MLDKLQKRQIISMKKLHVKLKLSPINLLVSLNVLKTSKQIRAKLKLKFG